MERRRRNSLCIFCYKPVSSLEGNPGRKCTPKVLQILSSYLNINLKPCDDLIKGELLSCGDCCELGDSFCDLLFQWENLRLQLEWRVRRLFERMRCAGRVYSRVNKFRTQYINEEDDSRLVCRDIQKLRGELLRGCKKQLKSSLPKVTLHRIPEGGERDEKLWNVSATKKLSPRLDKTEIMEGLMTFFAILHLSVPLHSQDSQNQHHYKVKKYWRVDKEVQTCSSGVHEQEQDDLPPILTPFDFCNEESDGVDSVPVADQFQSGTENISDSTQNLIDGEAVVEFSVNVRDVEVGNEKAGEVSNSQAGEMQQVVVVENPISAEPVVPALDFSANCQLCNAALDSPVLLTLHNRSVHKIRAPFYCYQSDCYYQTQSTVAFRLHMTRVHKSVSGIPGPFQCDTCQERFSSLFTLQRHANIHHATPQVHFKCKKCSQYFETKTKLHSHTYHLHGQSQRSKKRRKPQRQRPISTPFDSYLRRVPTINCPICKVSSKDQEALALHMRLTHQRILAYQCCHCSMKPKTVQGVRSHMKFIHNKIIKSDLKLLSRENVRYSYEGTNPHNQNGMESPSVALQTSTPSPSPQSFSGEVRCTNLVDVEEMPHTRYNCEPPQQPAISPSTSTPPPPQIEPERASVEVQINASSSSPSSTFVETEVVEMSPTNSPCELSALSFTFTPPPESEPESVELMIESLIGNITVPQAPQQQRRGFNCEFKGCGRSFSSNAYLRVHHRIHTGEKPFPCRWPGCYQRFVGRIVLRNHYKLHQISTPFRCEPCQLFFKNSTHLKRHLESEEHEEAFRIFYENNSTELQDAESSFAGAEVETGKENEEQHSPVWNCYICQASFSLSSQLTDHLCSEHGHQPVVKFGCKPCAKEFETSAQFVHHMFRVHGKVLQVREQEPEPQQPVHEVPQWKYVCPEVGCEVRCASQEEVINHMNAHGNVATPNRNVILQSEDYPPVPNSAPAVFHPVPQRSPQLPHVDERLLCFECAHCPHQAKDQKSLQTHIDAYHRPTIGSL